MNERWLPVVGFEGWYEVSDLGRVRSLARKVIQKNGHPLNLKPKTLKHGKTVVGHHFVVLSCNGIQTNHRVHQLVLAAFVGPRPVGLQSLHWDDNKDNNTLSNLSYGTPSDNMRDMIRNGLHHQVEKTHCKWGHEFTPENTAFGGRDRKYRRCLKCANARRVYYNELRAAQKHGQPLPVLTFPPADAWIGAVS